MRLSTSAILLVELASTALVDAGRPYPNLQRATAVRREFEASWNGYYKNAFPHDTLLPVTNTFDDDRNAWGATIVDGLSTAIIMGEVQIVTQMLDQIAKIDFTTTKQVNSQIAFFETNIRYLGGLIAGYDLLQGPQKSLGIQSSKVTMLMKQAQSLADTLSFAFDTPTGIPDGVVYINPTKRLSGATQNTIAGFGTLVLEWTRLSDISGNQTYAQLAQRAQKYLLRPTGSPQPWPGLVGTQVSIKDGTFLDSNGGWGGSTDSFYEYLIKMYLYDPNAFGEYKDRWVLAADSTMAHLASHPTTRKDLTYLSQYSGQKTNPTSGHLASFAGGNFILGGILLGEDKYKQFGLALTESYFNNYQQTAAGIGPEGFRWLDSALPSSDPNNQSPPASQAAFYKKAGFYSTSGQYILRPETSESIYYAYRLTGDTKWQDMAWQAFQNIKRTCKTGSAYGELRDVMQANGGGFINQMQSFWMAETMKYLFLVFAPESEVQLQGQGGKNSFVFNTEAHPVRVRN